MSLSSSGKQRIEQLVERIFDSMANRLVGYVPNKHKAITFATGKPFTTLANLFLQSANKNLNESEKDMARGLMKTSVNFVSALREKTKSHVVDSVDSMIQSKQRKGELPTEAEIKEVIKKELNKASSHLEMIVGTESTKIRNAGAVAEITAYGKALKVDDPYCFFLIVKDGKTCKHCLSNHLLSDGVTPRVFKLSEVKQGYLTKEERDDGGVSVAGIHPHCRCSLVNLTPGFGFSGGKVTWIGVGHDEYKKQREG